MTTRTAFILFGSLLTVSLLVPVVAWVKIDQKAKTHFTNLHALKDWNGESVSRWVEYQGTRPRFELGTFSFYWQSDYRLNHPAGKISSTYKWTFPGNEHPGNPKPVEIILGEPPK